MHLRIALDFSRNIFNILVISQMPVPVEVSEFLTHLWMNSWEWHLGIAWTGWGELGDLHGKHPLPRAGANSWTSGI